MGPFRRRSAELAHTALSTPICGAIGTTSSRLVANRLGGLALRPGTLTAHGGYHSLA